MAKNFAIDQANYMRYQVLTILEKPKQKRKINIAEKDCQKVRNWLKQNNLVLIESNKGRATCIIGESKVKAMMQTELSKTERYIPVNSDPNKTRQSIQWTTGYTIHWKPMKTILIVTKNSLIRT